MARVCPTEGKGEKATGSLEVGGAGQRCSPQGGRAGPGQKTGWRNWVEHKAGQVRMHREQLRSRLLEASVNLAPMRLLL